MVRVPGSFVVSVGSLGISRFGVQDLESRSGL